MHAYTVHDNMIIINLMHNWNDLIAMIKKREGTMFWNENKSQVSYLELININDALILASNFEIITLTKYSLIKQSIENKWLYGSSRLLVWSCYN